MTEITNDEQAAQALIEANQDTPVNEQEQEQPAVEGQDQSHPETDSESFTGLDPNALPEEALPFYKSMQADYTRKLQSVANERRGYEALEQYGGVEGALQAVQMLQNFNDPNFALTFYENLGNQLEALGLVEGDFEGEYEDDGGEEFIDNEQSDLAERLEAIEAYQQQQYQQAELNNVVGEIDQAEIDIKRNNPTWTDEDMDAVYNLAFSTGGDLYAAEELYKDQQQRWATAYLNSKTSVPAGARPTPGTQAIAPPSPPKTMDEADAAALEALKQHLAQQ